LDGAKGVLALVAIALLVLVGTIAIPTLGSSPFVWGSLCLAGICPLGFWPSIPARETGALLARAGVILALAAGQIEIGAGPRYYREGDAWLIIAALFALVALSMHLINHLRRRGEADAQRATLDMERAAGLQRHREIIAALTRHPSGHSSSRTFPLPLVGAIAIVMLRLRQVRRR
jgi:hypothetical protein